MEKKDSGRLLFEILHSDTRPPVFEQIKLVFFMSVPAIMAQIASVCMQYIDASMVGQLGADDSASIGLVSSSIWLLCSIGMAVNVGFTVLMAQKIGARKYVSARNLLKLAFMVCLAASLLLAGAGILVSDILPVWLGGNSEINRGASEYFLIFTSALPVLILNALSSGMLQSSGNMKLPSLLNMLMCLLDVVFNYLLIFPSREISFGGFSLVIPGCDLGIRGAALGTVAAEAVTFALMLFFLLFRTQLLRLRPEERFIFSSRLVRRALLISLPVGFDHIAMCPAWDRADCNSFLCHYRREFLLYGRIRYCRRRHHYGGSEHRGQEIGSCSKFRLAGNGAGSFDHDGGGDPDVYFCPSDDGAAFTGCGNQKSWSGGAAD